MTSISVATITIVEAMLGPPPHRKATLALAMLRHHAQATPQHKLSYAVVWPPTYVSTFQK